MKTVESDDRWDISRRPHTKTKLKILRKCFGMWFEIWSGPKQKKWVSNEWYIMDLFAGRGIYTDAGEIVSGSPLIFLETIVEKADRLKRNSRITLFLVDDATSVFNSLEKNVERFIADHPQIRNIVDVKPIKGDCNEVIETVVGQVNNSSRCPLFVLIDPWGIKIKKTTVARIIGLRNPKDIMFNYMLEGVRRTSGIAKKAYFGEELTSKEIRTVETLTEFIGDDVDVITASDREILEDYVNSVFTTQDLKAAACSIEYPDRNDILYYLLYASRKLRIVKIVMDIYDREKRNSTRQLTFGKEFDEDSAIIFIPRIREIKGK